MTIQEKSFILLTTILAISGCQSTNVNSESPYYLKDENILNSDSFDDLFNAWIPNNTKWNPIYFQSSELQNEAINAAVNGFQRYCDFSKSSVEIISKPYGNEYRCINTEGQSISFEYERYADNGLHIFYSSPSTREKKLNNLNRINLLNKEIEHLKGLNGPSGTVYMEDGSQLKFIRLGDITTRSLMHVSVDKSGDNDKKYIYIDDIKHIDFKNQYVTLKSSAEKKTFNGYGYTENYNEHYGNYGSNGLPLVVIDKYGHQPYTIRIPNLNDVVAIDFKDKSDMPGGSINSDFSITPYQESLKAHFQSQVSQMLKNQDIETYFDYSSIPSSLLDRLNNTLTNLSRNAVNMGNNNFVVGFSDGINYEALSQLALSEYRILDKGYKVSNKITPLSMFIIISELKHDISGTNDNGYDSLDRMLKNHVKELVL